MATKPDWCVKRLDDNGNPFVLRTSLRREAAEGLAHDYQTRGYKQTDQAVEKCSRGSHF